jgi:hypothetical protein
MSFDQAGERRTQSGSTFIVALRRTNANWQLTAWSWAKGQ